MAFEKFKPGPEDELRPHSFSHGDTGSDTLYLQIFSLRTLLPLTRQKVHTGLLSTGDALATSIFASWPIRARQFKLGCVCSILTRCAGRLTFL